MSEYLVMRFKCPSCGADLTFDAAEQVLKCTACGHKTLITSKEFLKEAAAGQLQGDENMTCPDCSGQLTFNRASYNARCDYCGSNYAVIDAENINSIPQEIDFIHPFTKNKEESRADFINWLNNRASVPIDIFSKVKVTEHRGVYIPVWSFYGNYSCSYTLDVGYKREEHHTEYEKDFKVERDKRTNEAEIVHFTKPVDKVETVIDWHPFSGTTSGSFSFKSAALEDAGVLNIPSSDGINDDLITKLPRFFRTESGTKGEAYDARYTAGYELIRPDKRPQYSTIDVESSVERGIKRSAPGDEKRNISYEYDYDIDYCSIAWPFWEYVYTYGGKEYVAFIEGTKANQSEGTWPKDSTLKKHEGYSLEIGIAVVCIVLALLSFFFMSMAYGLFAYVVGAIFAIVAVAILPQALRSKKIHEDAKAARNVGYEQVAQNPGRIF